MHSSPEVDLPIATRQSWLATPPEDRARWIAEQQQPTFRQSQIWGWFAQKRAVSFAQMTDLPLALRESLDRDFAFWSTQIARHQKSEDGTEKLLIRLHDGHAIETVLLRDRERRTICISTQVGCAMGCVFCASGIGGVVRNLSAAEIQEQILRVDRLLSSEERLSHIVVMGMGEPMANLDQLLAALKLAVDPKALGISPRRITISTVGLPAAIRRMAQEAAYQLAVSLHAPNDELRTQLVPVNHNIGLDEILAAASEYHAASGRRVTFEYVLLRDVNDRPEHARELARRLSGTGALVNLIPFNPVEGLPYRAPLDASVAEFRAALEQAHLAVKVRRRRGNRIDAACGQLRRTALAEAAVLPGSTAETKAGMTEP